MAFTQVKSIKIFDISYIEDYTDLDNGEEEYFIIKTNTDSYGIFLSDNVTAYNVPNFTISELIKQVEDSKSELEEIDQTLLMICSSLKEKNNER